VFFAAIAASRLVHHPVELFGIGEPHLDEPALAHRVGIDLGRIGDDVAIDRDDLARNRRVDLARGLRRFDDRRLLALFDSPAELGQFDIDDIAQLRLRVIGDADHGDVALLPHPFMVFREANRAHAEAPVGR
jgi:hypothetical protein